MDTEVVVVGGRPAGAALALRLARAGMRVTVLDRARFPSDVPSTHGIQPTGVRELRDLGCYDELAARTEPIEHGTAVFDDARIELRDVSALLGAPMLNVRRAVLDQALLTAAARAGADVRTRTAVTGLVTESGRVAGVTTTAGPVRAPLVVGADGARSTVARLVGAGEYHRTPPSRAFLWAYFRDAAHPRGHLWLGKVRDHGMLAGPTDGGLFLTALSVSAGREAEVRADPAAALRAGLRDWPEVADVLAGARRVGPLRTLPRRPGFFRRCAGPGWALVGDAGHVTDPTAGQGIADALRHTATLADAITAGPDGLDARLARWWAWRDRDAWPMYWFAHDLGAPGCTPPLTQELLRRVAADPRRASDLLRVLNHDLAPARVFTIPLVLSALARALAGHPGRRRAILAEARGLVAADLRRSLTAPSARVSRLPATGHTM